MKKSLLVPSWLFFIFLFSACGLDTFYFLNPPISQKFIDDADSSSSDPSNQYVTFFTSVNTESSDIFQGTSVYYKIYNNPNQLLSHKNTINNINTEYSDQGIARLNDWGYQLLSTTELTTSNLVSAANQSQLVSIRLSNSGNYPADVTIDGTSIGVPKRSFDNKTFSFSSSAEESEPNSVPKEGQPDVFFTSNEGTDIWYVALYAVSTGMSPSLTPVYSRVIYLGSLAITPSL